MLQSIASILPDWAMSIIIGGAIWFGINYIFLADNHFREAVRIKSCQTNYDLGSENLKIKMALYTSTIGLMESESLLISKICNNGK